MAFEVGDYVSVIVEKPRYGWGPVSQGDIGQIITCPPRGSDIYRICFPNKHINWGGRECELKLAKSEFAKKMQSIQDQPIL